MEMQTACDKGSGPAPAGAFAARRELDAAERKAVQAEARRAFLARRREQKRMVAERMKLGLRSDDLGRSGKLFVAGCRRAKDLRGGREKGLIQKLGPDKVLALDAPYIEGNREMVSLIRVDLDMVFFSPEHAIQAVREVVRAGCIPCAPHLIVGAIGRKWIDADGERTFHPRALIRPHLWIILPLGSAVVCTAKGRDEPKKLLAGVVRGICKAFIHLGADPNAPALIVRGKNPLSPAWWSACLNNEAWPTLTEWAEWVDTRVDRESLARLAAEVQSKTGKGPSNEAFNTFRLRAFAILRDLHETADPAYARLVSEDDIDREGLVDLLHERMPFEDEVGADEGHSSKEARAARRIQYVHGAVLRFAAGAWNPATFNRPRKARGAMRHVTDGMGRRDAQAASGRRSGAMKADQALDALVKAYRALGAEGVKLTRTAVAEAAGVARETASRRWPRVLEAVSQPPKV